ncbi:52 kDa repressor of the inhibitor of the protein kinase-like [Engraulis encrasicolus]|uniref:52 kDa repressor of the inhibitor of the protein kinase-like n=1 Tax=Engraulis encrasicolus TaxID=184585 RepID=UPI002FD2E808
MPSPKKSKDLTLRMQCSAINCTNYYSTGDLSFHRFPKDPQRCAKWVQNLRNASLRRITPERLNKNYRVCSAHFDDSQIRWRYNVRLGLTSDAVPTIVNAPNPPPPLGKRKPPKERHELPTKRRKTALCPPSEESTGDQTGDSPTAEDSTLPTFEDSTLSPSCEDDEDVNRLHMNLKTHKLHPLCS